MKGKAFKGTFDARLFPLGVISVPVCSKCTWDMLTAALASERTEMLYKAVSLLYGKLPSGIPRSSLRAFLADYREAVEEYCEEAADIFMIPDKPDFEGTESTALKLPIITYGERLVHEHTGLDFMQIGELDILSYRMYLADAVKIRILGRADGKGKEYLNECYDYMHRISSIFE